MRNYMYLVLLVLLMDVCLLTYYTLFTYLSLVSFLNDINGICVCETREYTEEGYCKQYDTCYPSDSRDVTIAEVFSLIRTHCLALLYLLLLVGIILESQKTYLAYMIGFVVLLVCLPIKIILFFSEFNNPDLDTVFFPGNHSDKFGVYIKLVFSSAEIFIFIVAFFIHRELQRNKNILFTLTAQRPGDDNGLALDSDIGSRAEVEVAGFLPKSTTKKGKKGKIGKKGKN